MDVTQTFWTTFLAGALAAGLSTAVNAQNVTLSVPDGSAVVSGDLIAFDTEFYTLRTSLGTLRIEVALVECEGEACPIFKPPTSEFVVSGPTEMAARLMPTLLASYANSLQSRFTSEAAGGGPLFTITDTEEDDLAKVQVVSSSSSQGLVDLLQGEASMALSTRPARRREVTAFENSGLGSIRGSQQEHVIALDGLVIVTSRDNPVRSISTEDAALVFSGAYTNWSQLGGPNAPINLYVRDQNSGTSEVFTNLVMRPQAAQIAADATRVFSDSEVSQLVANDPNAIGFTGFASRGNAKALPIRGVCGLVAFPNEFNIKTEEYPLTRRLFAYTSTEDAPFHVDKFVAFTETEAAQRAIADTGFVDQTISEASVDTQGLRFASAIVANRNRATIPLLQGMVEEMMGSDRLSATFRFQTGSSDLDTRAIADVRRLADLLREQRRFKKVVQLIGFTDSVGDPIQNRDLSLRRAIQVRDTLLSFAPDLTDQVEIRSIGYGEISPIACNETASGRLINRRVEVWISDDIGPT